jgi:DNA-3-methyladenine glycosylase II
MPADFLLSNICWIWRKNTPRHFKYGKKEIDWLKGQDPVLGAAIDKIGHIDRAVIPDVFTALVNSIVGQQISAKAHATVWKRMVEQFSPLTAKTIGLVPVETLQSCGISMRKALYIKEIADAVLNGSLNLDALKKMSDDELCARLIQLKGIGVWTAEMLMIFSLQRPNILCWNDLAIQRGLCRVYHHRKITPKLFAKYKKRYSPYASVASLYLWAIAAFNPLPTGRD